MRYVKSPSPSKQCSSVGSNWHGCRGKTICIAKGPILAILALLTFSLIACGGGEDGSQSESAPVSVTSPARQQAAIAPAGQQPTPFPVQQASVATPSQSETISSVPTAAQTPQPSLDDERVEALVGEWESDLALIARVAECVERTLGLERPLRPEDFDLQANQPAILSCVKTEVGGQ